jgi:hypothetical protein|tara:strand:- start:232 stop:552 length:321 start_codon:yes stop_codon:yes gene_type:complete
MSNTISVSESVLEHYQSQSKRLRDSSLKKLENYLVEVFLYQETEEQMTEFLKNTFELNTDVLHLAFKLISNELDFLCTDKERCEQINNFSITKLFELDESRKGGEV